MTDTLDREVHFEIVWVDDTTFLVAASFRGGGGATDEMEAILHDHGRIILGALRVRFPTESIVVLESHLRAVEAASENARQLRKHNWFDRVLSLIGLARKKRVRDADVVDNSRNKRRRVN